MEQGESDRASRLPGPGTLLEHLDRALDAQVAAVDELDEGVLRIGRANGPDWVMRVFPASRPLAAVQGDADILNWLERVEFPAERLASARPVSQVRGCPVLITRYADAVPREQRRDAIREAGGLRRLGALLGHLSTLEVPPGAPSRPGGAWHHFAEGHPSAELAAARAAIEERAGEASGPERAGFDAVLRALDEADDGDGLPEAFVHPDFVLANVVATTEKSMVIVDWAGAGRGPRVWPLAFLLWAEWMKNPARVDLLLAAYASRATLDRAELERLPAIIRARPLVFTAFGLRRGDITPARAAAAVVSIRNQADAVAARVHDAIARRP